MTARTATDSARDIPEATVARLPVYLRALTTLAEAGTATCSSEELAAAAGVNSAKLRKDLSYLGTYGTRGVGYDVDYLRYQIAREIGVTQDWPVVIVGIGNLGHALANYSGFRSRGFRVVALLDADPERTRRSSPASRSAPSTTSSRSSGSTVVDRRHRHPGRRRPGRRRPDGRRRDHAASSTSPRPCSRCPTGSTSARSTCRSSCRSSPTTSSARPRHPAATSAERRRGRPHERPRRRHLPPPRPWPSSSGSPSTPTASAKLLADVVACEHVTEATVIATCNRLEVYADVDRFHGSVEEVSRLLVERAGESDRGPAPHLYVHYDDGAVSHLFHVAAGLDSMAVGEGQILGQTREALRRGQEHGTVGPRSTCCSSRPCASASARTPRPTSTAPRRPWSAPRSSAPRPVGRSPQAVGRRAPARWPSLATATVSRLGAAEVAVVNRTPPAPSGSPPSTTPARSRCRPRPVELAARRPRHHLHRRHRRPAHPRRGRGVPRDGRAPLAIVDLALPHDVDPDGADLPGVTWSTCRPGRGAAGHDAAREVDDVRHIVAEEVAAFLAARRQASVTPTVVALRSMATAVVDAEMDRLAARLPDLDDATRAEVLPPCAGSPTSCSTSPPSGSRSSPTRTARCPTPPPWPSCSPSTPTPSTPSPAPRASRDA